MDFLDLIKKRYSVRAYKPDTVEDLQARFTRLVEAQGRKVIGFKYAKSVRETAPFEQQVVLDAQIV